MQNSLNHWKIFFYSKWTAEVECVQKPSWAEGLSPVGHRLHIAVLKLLFETHLITTIIQQVICELCWRCMKNTCTSGCKFSSIFPSLNQNWNTPTNFIKTPRQISRILILLHADRGKAREVERVKLKGNPVTFCHSCQQPNTQKVN